MVGGRPAAPERYHGLDGLRGLAMLLGIVLHASLPYFSRLLDIERVWPADDDQSLLLYAVFDLIHVWRMPVFFLLAGFFAHLVLERRAEAAFARDRLRRIALPLLLFGPVLAVALPPLWLYGWSGTVSPETLRAGLSDLPELDSSGGLVAHLWFLYYLLLMYAALLALRRAGRCRGPGRPAALAVGRRIGQAAYTRAPVLLALGAALLLVLRGGDESKPIWPLNVPDVLYGMLFFLYGYGLYARRALIERLRDHDVVAALLVVAAALFAARLVLLGIHDEASAREEAELAGRLELAGAVVYGSLAALISVGLVGLFELALRSPRAWVRWLADSSYWIYIMHLPVVAFLTFWLAHLDRQGWLERATGLPWGAEPKFLAASVATGAIGVVSYRYLVRGTALGALLNGRRGPSRPGR